MNDFKDKPNKMFIAIQSHYLNALKYFDHLYDYLLKENIEVIYIFRSNPRMEEYCSINNRKFEIINYVKRYKIQGIFNPISRYILKKEIEKTIMKYDIKVIIQYNDSGVYNDLIVKVAKNLKRKTLVLQWAITNPEQVDFKNRQLAQIYRLKNMNFLQILHSIFLKRFLNLIYTPFYIALGVYSNHKLSMGQGDSDYFGVINEFSKNLFIKQGVDEKKIKVLGLLDYDDALEISNKNIDKLKEKFRIGKSTIVIIYFSQPFYRKDLTILTLEQQLNYTEDLISNIDKYYTERGINYKLFIKLHPAEYLNDYQKFLDLKNVRFFTDVDKNELILIANLCISQHSTVLQNVIVLNKPVICLNILNLKLIEIGADVLGIKKCISSWEEFNQTLKILEEKKYTPLNNINYDRVILDGNCYNRTISLIKTMINITEKRFKS